MKQVALKDPVQPNPTVSELTRRSARTPLLKCGDGNDVSSQTGRTDNC
jgi:hypothetical protein